MSEVHLLPLLSWLLRSWCFPRVTSEHTQVTSRLIIIRFFVSDKDLTVAVHAPLHGLIISRPFSSSLVTEVINALQGKSVKKKGRKRRGNWQEMMTFTWETEKKVNRTIIMTPDGDESWKERKRWWQRQREERGKQPGSGSKTVKTGRRKETCSHDDSPYVYFVMIVSESVSFSSSWCKTAGREAIQDKDTKTGKK